MTAIIIVVAIYTVLSTLIAINANRRGYDRGRQSAIDDMATGRLHVERVRGVQTTVRMK